MSSYPLHPGDPGGADRRPAPSGPQQGWGQAAPAPAGRNATTVVLAALGFALLALIGIGVAAYLVFALGTGAAFAGLLLATVPLVVVLLTVKWIDRWEPEPRAALLFALLWGAAASVAIALVFSFVAQIGQALAGIGDSYATVLFSAVVQAPIVEEFAKGFGVLLLFWAFRRHFDGPVDGLVYAAVIAVGFAFTENIQYFGLALAGSDLASVSEIFFLRAVLSPFAHVMFTACLGIILGIASRRASGAGAIGYFLVGLVPAIALHALWNGAAFLVGDFYAYYLVVQVPLFLLAVGIVLYLLRVEQRITSDRLAEYAAAGWFSRDEVAMLSTPTGRARAKAWASSQGIRAPFAHFVSDATRLAFARQRVISSRDRIGAQRDEADLLAAITADRRAIAAHREARSGRA